MFKIILVKFFYLVCIATTTRQPDIVIDLYNIITTSYKQKETSINGYLTLLRKLDAIPSYNAIIFSTNTSIMDNVGHKEPVVILDNIESKNLFERAKDIITEHNSTALSINTTMRLNISPVSENRDSTLFRSNVDGSVVRIIFGDNREDYSIQNEDLKLNLGALTLNVKSSLGKDYIQLMFTMPICNTDIGRVVERYSGGGDGNKRDPNSLGTDRKDGLSKFSVFIILIIIMFVMYCVIGSGYNYFVINRRTFYGIIPNGDVWVKILKWDRSARVGEDITTVYEDAEVEEDGAGYFGVNI